MEENVRRSGELQDLNLASRKAEESALRRYQAIHWLECFVGPLGKHSKPSEKEFISCLRNGIILCNVINKIQPGCIPKVVDNNEPVASELSIWDSKPLPAYQYFENIRNFLMAVKELKLPAFEASDLEREIFEAEAAAAARIADCILALKSYHEWKEWSGGNGVYKHVTVKSPVVLQSASKNFGRSLTSFSAQPCRQLEMSPVNEKQSLTDSIVKAFTNHMVNSKENIHNNFLSSLQNGSQGSVQLFTEILSRCLEEKLKDQSSSMLKSSSQDSSGEAGRSSASLTVLQEISSLQSKREFYGAQTRKGDSDHWRILRCQEKDLSDIKSLWYKTKEEFEDMQTQILNDLVHIGSLVEEMSSPALAYQKVVQENRKLYNLAQDLKGNVRVYCRIRPIINAEAKNMVDFVGQDGSLVIVDPSKPRSEGRKVFQFNQVYGPTAKQDEVFKEIQPLIRSVMDGYNVCIMAYGQTGSGKTHTMFGSSGVSVSEKEMGINYFSLKDLFQTAGRRPYVNYDVRVQMVRICNEQIQDLLVEDPLIHNDSGLLDAAFHSVKSFVDANNLVKLGERKHILKMDNLTDHSHSVITIRVHGKDTSGNILHGSLFLVDLASSEENNTSLSCLEELITSFSQKSSSNHQSSKITSILQDAFGGNAKVVVFAHVNPEGENFTETISTLRFTQKISTIDLGAALSNKKNIEVMELKQEIELLKCALGDKDARSPQTNRKLILSTCDKTRPTMDKSPVKSRRLSIENPGSMKSEKRAKSPLPRSKATENPSSREIEKISDGTRESNDPLKSPVKKPILQGSFPRSRRLSIENPESIKHVKLVKSPILKQKLAENAGTGRSDKLSDGTTGRSKDPPKSPSEKPMIEGSRPRSRRLSIENPMVIGSEKKQKLKEPKSPSKEQIILKRKTPPKTRRQSIENPNSMKPVDIRKSSNIPQTSLSGRRLSSEPPKNFTKEQLHSTNVINSMDNISIMECPKSPSAAPPTFTDCATKFPSFKPPKTPEQQSFETNDLQTPDVGKSTTHKKGSQIKRSLRTIGKLINGSEKRNQQKVESSSSMKGKGSAVEPKSPPTAKARALRRRSLTAIPAPPGLDRRSSLGGSSTDARSSDRRNAKSPPSVRSSTKFTGRWM